MHPMCTPGTHVPRCPKPQEPLTDATAETSLLQASTKRYTPEKGAVLGHEPNVSHLGFLEAWSL